MSVEAVCKVTDNPLPVEIDELLVQYVEPALTPRRHRCQIDSPENEYGIGVYCKPPPPEPVTLIHESRVWQPAYSILLLDLSRRAQAASDLERVRRRPLPGGRRLKMHAMMHCLYHESRSRPRAVTK